MAIKRQLIIFFTLAIAILALDQAVKILVLNLAESSNPIWKSDFIDIVLVFNRGVAFSLGSFLGDSLKWIILLMLIFMLIFVLKNREFFAAYYMQFALIIGSGFSNLIDRFIHNGVVDYVFWHFGFKFAVFNLADSVINIAVAWIFLQYLLGFLKERKTKSP